MRSVLITRPQPFADELADKLRREGFKTFIAPMTEYVEIHADYSALNSFQGLVFTSAQAVNFFSRRTGERNFIVFAVGDTTALAAGRLGFSTVFSAEGDSDDVITLIRSKKEEYHLKKLLHVCGADTVQDIGTALLPDEIEVTRLSVYKAQYLDVMPPETDRTLIEGDIDVVTLFSARTAANFVRLLQRPDLKGVSGGLEALCISERVAAELKSLPWAGIRIAKNPHLEAMLEILRSPAIGTVTAAALPADPVIDAFGGIRPLANRLGITASTVQGWKNRGLIPETRVRAILTAAAEDNIDLDKIQKLEHKKMNDSEKTQEQRKSEFQERRRSNDRRQKHTTLDEKGHVRTSAYAGPDRRTGLDRRAYEERQQQRIRAEKWRFFNRSVLTAAFLFIPVVLAGVFLMAPEYFELESRNAQLQQMEEQMKQMNERILQMQQAQEKQASLSGKISSQIGKFSHVTEAVKETAGALVDTASSQISAVGSVADKSLPFLQLLTNINTLSRTAEGRSALTNAVARLKDILAGSSGNADDMNAAVAVARKQDPALSTIMGHIAPEDLGAAAMLLALNEFRENVNGERPFQNDLVLMRKLAGKNAALQKALDRLTPYAKNGVLSRSTLQKEFKNIAADIVMAKLQGKDLSVQEEMLKRLDRLVKVRRIDDIDGQSVDAVVARAQLRLDQGDVTAAMQELQTLQGAPAETAAPWMAQATGSMAAGQTAEILSQTVLEQMSSTSGFSLEGLISTITDTLSSSGGNVPYMSPAMRDGQTPTYVMP